MNNHGSLRTPREETWLQKTHGGSFGGGGASLTISTLKPCTPVVAIWYEVSSVILMWSQDTPLRSKKRKSNIDVGPHDKTLLTESGRKRCLVFVTRLTAAWI